MFSVCCSWKIPGLCPSLSPVLSLLYSIGSPCWWILCLPGYLPVSLRTALSKPFGSHRLFSLQKKVRLFTLMLDFLFDTNLPNKLLYLPLFLRVCLLHLHLTVLKTDKKTDGADKGPTEVTTIDWQDNTLRQMFKLIFNLIQQSFQWIAFLLLAVQCISFWISSRSKNTRSLC